VNLRAEFVEAGHRFRVFIGVRLLVVRIAGFARLDVFLVCRVGKAAVDGRNEGILDR